MPRFNPFYSETEGPRYGAAMGRRSDPINHWDGKAKLYARHCGGDGYYDSGGVYWGHSDVYAVFTHAGSFCCYVDNVPSCAHAIGKVKLEALALLDAA